MTITKKYRHCSKPSQAAKLLAYDDNDANDDVFPTFKKSNKPDWEVWET